MAEQVGLGSSLLDSQSLSDPASMSNRQKCGSQAVPSEDGVSSKSAPRKGDENRPDGGKESVPKGRRGSSGRGPGDGGSRDHWQDLERKESNEEHDSRSASEPKKFEENPVPKFSCASKYAALSVDGDDEAEGEEYAD